MIEDLCEKNREEPFLLFEFLLLETYVVNLLQEISRVPICLVVAKA